MAVNIVDIEGLDWSSVGNTWAGKAPDGLPGVRFKPFPIGDGPVPKGQLVEYEVGHFEGAHSHDEDEILFLLSGELRIDEKQLSPGMLIYIEGGTVYGPLQSNEGCRFLRLHLAGQH
jgi:quercetin dioxygenase-like cupin family protein